MAITFPMQGDIYSIGTPKTISDKFVVREFILRVERRAYKGTTTYDYVSLQTYNEGAKALDGFAPGDCVTVAASPRGRLYTNKDGKETCFTSLYAASILPMMNVNTPDENGNFMPIEEDDDAPF